MKVILLTDVPKVGNRYDVKEFKDGYAINVLVSKGLAEMATPQALAKLASKKAEIDKKKEEQDKAFSLLIASVDNKKISIKVKANDKGHLFRAVNSHDIVSAIKNEMGIVVEENMLVMEHIKELGTHKIKIKKGDREGVCEIILENDK